MISRCSKTRDRMMNRSEWSSEKTTDATERGYRRMYVTSIHARCTVFSIATAAAGVRSRRRGLSDDGAYLVTGRSSWAVRHASGHHLARVCTRTPTEPVGRRFLHGGDAIGVAVTPPGARSPDTSDGFLPRVRASARLTRRACYTGSDTICRDRVLILVPGKAVNMLHGALPVL